MHRGFLPFIARRAAAAAALVLLVSSSSLVLVRLAPGDHLSGFDIDPVAAAAERDRAQEPILRQYIAWLRSAVRFDLGDSLRYRRPVSQLLRERAGNSFVLGACALLVATAVGIPAGVVTGSRRAGWFVTFLAGASVILLSVPSLLTALALLLVASHTGWFPVGGMAPSSAPLAEQLRSLTLPVTALALPMAATLERLQSRAIADALAEPCLLAASARGLSGERLVWRHAWKLSLKPVLALYGIVIGALFSGSFAVEYIMAWPGLGALMYEALVARDTYLVTGCAAVGSVALALGILASDIALAAIDPRSAEA